MTVKVLSFNLWLLEILGQPLSMDYEMRLRALPDAIAGTKADILFLQEVWTSASRKSLMSALRNRGYHYFSHTNSELPFGNGLLNASRFPLDDRVDRLDFRNATAWFENGIRKGAIKTRALVPGLGWVDLVNAHLGSVSMNPRSGEFHTHEAAAKKAQAIELANWIQNNQTSSVMLMGADLNTHPTHHRTGSLNPEYQLLRDLRLVDTLSWFQKDSDNRHTYCTRTNKYAQKSFHACLPPEQVDYVFSSPSSNLRATDSRVVFRDPYEELQLSDHYGVITEFAVAVSH